MGESIGQSLLQREAGTVVEFAGGARHVEVQVAAHQIDPGRGEGGTGAGDQTGEQRPDEATAAPRPGGRDGHDTGAAAGQLAIGAH